MAALAHSYSSLKTYENCPKRYFHERIEKRVKDQGGAATEYGDRVHKALEDYVAKGIPLTHEASPFEAFVSKVKAATGTGTTVLVEQQYCVNRDMEARDWWAEDAFFRAKLDVLALKQNWATVLDWKTGKRRPDFTQLEMFALITFLFHPSVEIVTAGFVWLQDAKIDKEVYKRDNIDALVKKLWDKIDRVEASVESGIWPAKPSGLCNYCPCRQFCEYRR